MPKKTQQFILAFCIITLLVSLFIICFGIMQLQHGIIVDKEIVQPQYITDVKGPPLYVDTGYKITIFNGFYQEDKLIDPQIYEQLEIGDIF